MGIKSDDRFADDPEVPQNIIELSSRQRKDTSQKTYTVFYINEKGEWLNQLSSCTFLETEDIRSLFTLRTKFLVKKPDLVFIDMDSNWFDPVDLILEIHSALKVPVVMICDHSFRKKNALLLKQAFASGLYDSLFTPLKQDELMETLNVLLKYRGKALGNL